MSTALAIGFGLFVAAGALRWLLRRAALSARAKPGTAPTPEHARIETERAELLEESAQQAEDEATKVQNADNDTLDDLVRDELLGPDTSAGTSKPAR